MKVREADDGTGEITELAGSLHRTPDCRGLGAVGDHGAGASVLWTQAFFRVRPPRIPRMGAIRR